MKTSQILKERVGGLWEKYVKHEFVKQMKEGTLPQESFRYYLIQDSKYVEVMLRGLMRASSFAPSSQATQILSTILNTRDKGMEVHNYLLDKLGITHEEITNTGYNLANYAYTRHLYYYSTKGWKEFLSAWAPCMWGYYEVGKYVADSPNQLFSKWAEFYASDEYKRRVEAILGALDSYEFSEDLLIPFSASVRFEIMFWEYSLRREETPFYELI
ncbi:TenA family protein [Stygiolobus caldivivus]|uniref:TenA family transcriptional regulator n=1 Tax=Stygiolobus caldivivus TaxID=2824673 RepID=A0A8D5ZEJ8_9CREN|nr:TenA family protein [Stygiolobus caldivivus]BCU69718.1 TenA family transcriptional regulator [Stygiolobus caldivivus]